ncbi:MAG: protein-tyrosine-phosphatase [Bacteroidota bacterium]
MLKKNTPLFNYIQERAKEFESIPKRRKQSLGLVSELILPAIMAGRNIRFVFVCSHNSRRSQFCQIWAQVAALYYSVDHLLFYSGGTEGSSIHKAVIQSLKKAGLLINKETKGKNPHYIISAVQNQPLGTFYSKRITAKENPKENFCAVITCPEAEKKLNLEAGTHLQVSMIYDDPRKVDGTKHEQKTYDKLCKKIATEMLYIISHAQKIIADTEEED